MKRRDFVKAGVRLGSAGFVCLSAASCAPTLRSLKLSGSPASISLPDMETYLANMDYGMDRLSKIDLAKKIGLTGTAAVQGNEFARKSLRTLYLTGMVGDLPEEGQIHPGVQARLWRAAPEMDDAVTSMTHYLSGLTSTEKADIQLLLQHRSNPGMEVTQMLTEEATRLGLSRRRYMQTRAIATQAVWRLRNQPPGLIIDEYVEKVQKLTQSDGSNAMAQRRLAAKLGPELFWRAQKMQMNESEASSLPPGVKAMGFGILIFAGGGLLVAAGALPGVFLMTVGAVVFVIGLLIFILSGLARALD